MPPHASVPNSLLEVTGTHSVPRAVNPEQEALGGKKALTPIIAGSICGGVLFVLWGIGFAVYFKKRYRRKQRNRLVAAGKAKPRPKDLEAPKEKILIPPDPAVLLGQHQPGEMLFPERRNSKDGHHHHIPWSRSASHVKSNGESATVLETVPAKDDSEEPSAEVPEENIAIVEEMTVPLKV